MDINITISLERYNELIQAEQKAKQYKNYFLENTQNNQFNKTLCAIECKTLYQLIKESQVEKGEKNEQFISINR